MTCKSQSISTIRTHTTLLTETSSYLAQFLYINTTCDSKECWICVKESKIHFPIRIPWPCFFYILNHNQWLSSLQKTISAFTVAIAKTNLYLMHCYWTTTNIIWQKYSNFQELQGYLSPLNTKPVSFSTKLDPVKFLYCILCVAHSFSNILPPLLTKKIKT